MNQVVLKDKKKWTLGKAERFYEELLVKALASLPEEGAVMVLGPMFIIRAPEENFKLFASAQEKLEEEGVSVFNQLPYVDYNLPTAPFRYDVKFAIFYKGLIESGKITACYLLPMWEQSEGTKQEVEYCKKAGVPINLL